MVQYDCLLIFRWRLPKNTVAFVLFFEHLTRLDIGKTQLEIFLASYINSASIVGRKIESTLNTQLSFSFSTPPSTVNSQQSTVNNNSGATGIDITPQYSTTQYVKRSTLCCQALSLINLNGGHIYKTITRLALDAPLGTYHQLRALLTVPHQVGFYTSKPEKAKPKLVPIG